MRPVPTTRRFTSAAVTVVTINLFLGAVGYYVAFLFAYAFSDEVETSQHVFFLVVVAVIAAVLAVICLPTALRTTGASFGRSATFTGSVVASAHALALGLGTIVSNLHTDEGSVTASWSRTTMVAVPAVFLAAAILAAAGAVQVARRQPASS